MAGKALFKYRLGYLACLFASNTHYRQITISDSQLSLTDASDRHKTCSYLEIDHSVQLTEGWFWSTIELTLFDGGSILLGGLPKSTARELAVQIKFTASAWLKNFLTRIRPSLTAAYQEAKNDIFNDRYIQRPTVKAWLDKYEYLQNLASFPKLDDWLSEQYVKQFTTLKPLLVDRFTFVEQYNRHFINQTLSKYSDFFDSIESQPLTQRQREACVINEKNNLVLAGAGTGKTSTMVGRCGYLIESGLAEPEQILMLAFGRDAADEMAERVKEKLGCEQITISTFHSLGQSIITAVEGKKPSINKMSEDGLLKSRFVDECFTSLMNTEAYRAELIKYFVNHAHQYKSAFHFKTLGEYNQYILENDIRTLQGELVKSYEECEIANFLFRNGINYKYEENYQVNTSGPDFRVYQPDFYLPDYGIYIEHFAIDENDRTPPFIDNAKYLEGIKWKRDLHKKYGSTLIETYSYQKRDGSLLKSLSASLQAAEVTLSPIPDSKLLQTINEFGLISKLGKLLSDLLTLFKSTLMTIQDLYTRAQQSEDSARATSLFKLFEPIYNAYQKHLKKTQTIDFDDMIAKAIEYVESGQYLSRFTHILVDEFQDISSSRARLIKALLSQQENSTLFCVGDDWQSIYQFTGSDISIIRDFQQHFGYTATTKLDLTFRFNNKIGDVASKFVMANPLQLKKQINSHVQVNDARISLLIATKEVQGLEAALGLIAEKTGQAASVLVLVRFRHDKPALSGLKRRYPHLQLTCMTAHAAKGKEADYVIVLGLKKGEFGFPSEKTTHPILQLLLPQNEPFSYAEERRLFYVALTRARQHVYLVTDPDRPSRFVRELKNHKNNVIEETPAGYGLSPKISETPCPVCQSGYMVSREGQNGRFYGCSDYPLCHNTSSGCRWCGHVLKEVGRFRICESDDCQFVEPVCPKCHGSMVLRHGRYGAFWGCSRYNTSNAFSCDHTEKYIDLDEARAS